MGPVLEAEGLSKSYGPVEALADLSLSVDAGEVFGLIGPNGAGKTTLVRCLTGTTRPDSGAVRLFGRPPGTADRSRVGLLPQAFTPHERLTARELVRYYAGLYDHARHPEDLLGDVGLADAADARYATLSGGQRRRVCVATALVNDPDLLFLDEPTTGIDPAGRRAMWELIAGLADRGTTVFLTTHSMAEAERLADRVGLLAAGELVVVGSPADLVAEHGGGSHLTVEAAGPVPSGLDTPGFAAERRGRTLRFDDVPPGDVPEILRLLDREGVRLEAFEWRRPDLEDVYLRLAGSFEGAGAEGDVPSERPVAPRTAPRRGTD